MSNSRTSGRSDMTAICEEGVARLTDFHDALCQKLFRSHPLLDPPGVERTLRELVARKEFRELLDLEGPDQTPRSRPSQ